MPRARKILVAIEATPYYHYVSRCVRGAFLCGKDKETGHSFEHRRQWIEERILELSAVFAVDVCAYAVMSNHYHVVLHINQALADSWSDHEVVSRWHQLFKGHTLSQRFLREEKSMDPAEIRAVQKNIKKWRERLCGLSWFIPLKGVLKRVRCVNEPIAREANREDNATGRFWEGRFTSQALLDEKALAACLAYVDLNPVRAQMAKTPESSEHTSIKRRIECAQQTQIPARIDQQPSSLMPFAGNPRNDMPTGLPFRLQDYIELIDWTGRILREDKRGSIDHSISPILSRLQLDAKNWLYLTQHFESPFKHLVGTACNIR